ncbi:MAG: C_GCAxxG_C_C family protein [Gammaproteobacteria bacterium]|nr:C_GCAxxG_C_C family protein [Gammaproteobacteria bacterium]
MSDSKPASEQFNNGLNCSQSIIAKYAEKYNLDVATACRLATGFGGGMGRQAKTCGALTGAYLVLGLEFGSSSPADKEKKELAYEKVREFTEEFEQRHGCTNCKGLLGCDIGTDEGRKIAREKDLHETHCSKFVDDATAILDKLIED